MDFAGFYVAGQLTLEGAASDAYNPNFFFREIAAFCGKINPMPWAYPPPFELVVAIPSLLPYGFAFAFVAVASYTLYCVTLKYLATSLNVFFIVRFLAFPSVFVALLCGQYSLLVASLIGWVAFATLNSPKKAGIPLGFLVMIKPHLAISLILLNLMQKRWSLLVQAATTAVLIMGFATVALGPRVWPAFFFGASQTTHYLTEGVIFPFFRMVSLFAAGYTISRSLQIAWVVQAVVIVICVYWLRLVACQLKPREALGSAVMLSTAFSPYAYDYDLAILAISGALLLPSILREATRWQLVILFIFYVFSTAYGFIASTVFNLNYIYLSISQQSLSLSGIFYFVMISIVIFLLLGRKPRLVST